MQLVLLVFCLILKKTTSLDAHNCVDIVCSNIFSEQCIEVFASYVEVSPCQGGSYCPSYDQLYRYENWTQINCEPSEYQPIIDICFDEAVKASIEPGFECCTDENCITGSCTDRLCDSLSIGDPCDSSDLCKANTYCDTSNNETVCISAKDNGDSCESDVECRAGSGCNLGYCTKLFSLATPKKVEDPKFCSSGYAPDDYCDLIEVYVNNKKLKSPFECDIGDYCSYRSYNYQLEIDLQPCLCNGKLESKKGYCGNYLELEETNAIKITGLLEYSGSNCAGNRTHSGDAYTI